jgi:GT2 family glycosyltransferase
MIAVVLLTHNRVHLLRRCVENVIHRTSELTTQIVVWNNASDDGTREYLDSLDDPRLEIVHSADNAAMNALPRAVRLTDAPYLIELDDDVVDAPERWDETLLDAFRRLPGIGWLGASIAFDPSDSASRYLHYMREEVGAYTAHEVDGLQILRGPVGGACTITSRELLDRVGGFKEHGRLPYWRPDVPYRRAIAKLGYDSAFLVDLEVCHQGGPSHSEPPLPKLDYHVYELKWKKRKDSVKRVILGLPFAAALNRRHGWFDPPLPRYDPESYDPETQAETPPHPRQAS